MPYTEEHKRDTRERIVECARQLFNRKGFVEVSIDEIMAQIGLTRGGFYNHFKTKEDLFVEAIEAYGRCNPADRWEGVELDYSQHDTAVARQVINAYLSREHLADLVLLQGDIDGFRAPKIRQCKARSAGNGCSLSKDCNAAVAYFRGSRRAGRETAIRGVARA